MYYKVYYINHTYNNNLIVYYKGFVIDFLVAANVTITILYNVGVMSMKSARLL